MSDVTLREKRSRRRRGLCAKCGKQPRATSAGATLSYCRACLNEYQRSVPSYRRRANVPDVTVSPAPSWFGVVYDTLIGQPDFPEGKYIRYAVKTMLRSGELDFDMCAEDVLEVLRVRDPLTDEA